MQQLRYLHRAATLVIGIILLFLAITGTLIQAIDLRSLYTHAAATDPNVQAMRESFDGPPDYAVRTTQDYSARPLPADTGYAAMLARVIRAADRQVGDLPKRYVDLRMAGDVPVGIVGLENGHVRFDGRTGMFLDRVAQDTPEAASPDSTRNMIKRLHRMTTFGDWASYINVVAAAALVLLVVTGTLIYLKLLGQRRRMRRPALFWSGGGTWRSLHRAVSLACVLFIGVVTVSGAWLTMDGLYRSIDVARTAEHAAPPTLAFAAVRDADLAPMLTKTLAGVHAAALGVPITAIRLRTYGGYRQGIVITGGDVSEQLVFNAVTGATMRETEPGYPRVHFPFGWQAHQWAKSVHRGDIIGLTGRWMDLIAGVALLYLSLSGGVMYWQMWQRRRASGRRRLLWK